MTNAGQVGLMLLGLAISFVFLSGFAQWSSSVADAVDRRYATVLLIIASAVFGGLLCAIFLRAL